MFWWCGLFPKYFGVSCDLCCDCCVVIEDIVSCVLLFDTVSLSIHWGGRATGQQRSTRCCRCLQPASNCSCPNIWWCIYFWRDCSDFVQTGSLWWPTDAEKHDCNGKSHGSWYNYLILAVSLNSVNRKDTKLLLFVDNSWFISWSLGLEYGIWCCHLSFAFSRFFLPFNSFCYIFYLDEIRCLKIHTFKNFWAF